MGHEAATAYECGWSTLKNGELLARELQRRTAKTLDVASAPGTGEEEQSLPLEDVAWVARVLWVRQ